MDIRPGDVVSNIDVVREFKCANMGGMRRSKETNTLVIISDHTKGLYKDKWYGNIIHYTGMGKNGDQDINFAQNKTLNESKLNGVAIHLFEVFIPGKYTYKGEVELAANPYSSEQNGEDGQMRKVWIFPLRLKLDFDETTKPINSNSTDKDYLDREHISRAITSYIKAKKDSISTVGVFSTWGNGKSSFIKNILEKLKEEPARNEVEILPIEIDAVFSDDCEKIWIIIYKKLIEEYKNQISNCRFIQNFLKLIFHLCSIGILYLLFSLLSIKPLLVYGYIFLLVYSLLFLLFIEFKRYYKWLNNLSLKIQDFLLETIIYFRLFYKPTIILIANAVMFFMLKTNFIKYTEDVNIANFQINKASLITGIISALWIFCDFTKNIVSVLNKESFINAYKHEEKLGFKSVIHEKIKNVIEKIIDGKDRKILIIVDELDRANLEKINEIIESTHILLNNNNLMLLFSVNPRQIGKALLLKEESLGNEIDIYKYGRHYIEKYMDVYVYLPFSKDYSSLLENLIEDELEVEENQIENNIGEDSFIDEDSISVDYQNEIIQSDAPENKKIIKFSKDEKEEIKRIVNQITNYSNLTPRKVKTTITLSTLAIQIFNSKNETLIKEQRLSLMKFILISLALFDFIEISDLLKEKDSTYTKFENLVVRKIGTEGEELVENIDVEFIDNNGKQYLSLFAEELDFDMDLSEKVGGEGE